MRAVLSYLILVGLPLLGLVAVIEKGKALNPPVSVRGDWKAELVSEGSVCVSRRVSPSFTIQVIQSGPQLTLVLKEGASAKLQGEILHSRISARAPDRSLEFQAEVEKREKGDRLSGFLSFNECRESGNLHFSAVKNLSAKPIAARSR